MRGKQIAWTAGIALLVVVAYQYAAAKGKVPAPR
jgi:hypothetical protein